MPTIRWLNCYHRSTYVCWETTLKWELSQEEREVSGEWTIANRPFIIPEKMYMQRNHLIEVGLLLKSCAVLKKTRCDVGSHATMGILKWTRRHKKLNPGWFDTHAWEAVCYPDYVAIVVTSGCKNKTLDTVLQASSEFELPVLIYQELKNSDNGKWRLAMLTN